MNRRIALSIVAAITIASVVAFERPAQAQDILPADNGLATYHTSPRYRESESHPLRVAAYVLHPVGWVLREAIFRPLSYFASSTEETRSVMGYREPYDYRQPECFTADDSAPDCRTLPPFNYDSSAKGNAGSMNNSDREVYLPDVNFDFDKRTLNDLGEGRVHQLANLLKQNSGNVKIVLQGNTDFKGSDSYNTKLGMDRAEAVRKELIALGVPSDRVETVTFGKSQPALTEQTDWARAVNRRVEVKMEK